MWPPSRHRMSPWRRARSQTCARLRSASSRQSPGSDARHRRPRARRPPARTARADCGVLPSPPVCQLQRRVLLAVDAATVGLPHRRPRSAACRNTMVCVRRLQLLPECARGDGSQGDPMTRRQMIARRSGCKPSECVILPRNPTRCLSCLSSRNRVRSSPESMLATRRSSNLVWPTALAFSRAALAQGYHRARPPAATPG